MKPLDQTMWAIKTMHRQETMKCNIMWIKKEDKKFKTLLDKLWRVISIVGQSTEIFLNQFAGSAVWS